MFIVCSSRSATIFRKCKKILPEHLHTTVYFIDLFIAKRYKKMACFSNGDELDVYVKAVVQRCSVKKVFSEISQNSHENSHRPGPATLLKKSFWHRCFPVNFVKFLRTPFLKKTSDGCFYIFQFNDFSKVKVRAQFLHRKA